MHSILCSSPVILCNPNWWMYGRLYPLHLANGKYIQVTSMSQTKTKLSPRAFGVTLDNYHEFYFTTDDGEVIPAFLLVKCNKCPLCIDKKKRDMSIRSICETYTSTHQPIFITLTYNNESLPEHGLMLSDLQKFLKRVRITFRRQFGYKLDLRYLGCGEYGHWTKRPHYHLLLWNFDYVRFGNSHRFLLDARLWLQELWPFGFLHAKFCDSGSSSYICKYMYKDGATPRFCNKPFIVSSRGHGGIGSRYIDAMRDYYTTHTDDIYLRVKEKYTGTYHEVILPSYFRNRLFPTKSKLTPPSVRRAYTDMCFLDSMFDYLVQHGYVNSYEVPFPKRNLYDKYFHLTDCGTPSASLPRYIKSYIDRFYISSPALFDDLFNDYLQKWNDSTEILESYEPDYISYFHSVFIRSRSDARFNSYFDSLAINGYLNFNKLEQKIIKNKEIAINKEIF